MGSDKIAGFIPDAQFVQAADASQTMRTPGFIPDSDFQSAEDAYGGVGGVVATGALGLASGLTLGLSNVALTKSGLVAPETLRGLQETNPGANIAGEIASVFVPGGAASLIGKAGKAVYGATKAVEAAKTAHEVSKAAKVLGVAQDIGAQALGSAVEGAIFAGVGNTMNEWALGDPSLNGEKILSHFGHGALIGGALGSAIKGVSIAAPEGLKAAKDGILKVRNALIGTGEESAGLVGKVAPPKISEAIANRTTNLDSDGRMQLIKEVTDSLNTTQKNINTTIKTLNQEFRPKELAALIDSADGALATEARQNIIYKLNDAVQTMAARPALYGANAREKLLDVRDNLVHGLKAKKSPSQIFESLKEADQRLGAVERGIAYSDTAADTKALVGQINDLVGQTMKNPDVFGFAAASYAEHNRSLARYFDFIAPHAKSMRGATEFQKTFGAFDKRGNWSLDPKKVESVFKRGETITGQQKMQLLDDYFRTIEDLPGHIENTLANVPNAKFDSKQLSNIIENSETTVLDAHKKYMDSVANSKSRLGMGDWATGALAAMHPMLGAAMGAYNVYTKPIETLNKLAELERLIGKTTNLVGQGAKAIFNPSLKFAGKFKGLHSKFLDGSTAERQEQAVEIHENLAQLVNDPNDMIERLNAATEGIYGAAPDTTTALQQTAAMGAQFLLLKLPIAPQANPLEPRYVPSATELASFAHYLKTVEDPVGALEEVKAGSLTPETIETLQTVYPKLYDEMKQKVLTEMTDAISKKEVIPYRVRQSLSLFLGHPVDSTMNPTTVLAYQLAYATPEPQAQPQKFTAGGAQKMTMAQRMKTRQERPE